MSSVRDQPQIRRYKNCIEFSYRFYRWRGGKEVNLTWSLLTRQKTRHHLLPVIFMLSWLPHLLLSCTTQQSQTYNEAYDKQNSDTILYTNITFHLADAFVQSDVYMKYNPSHRWQWCFMSVMQYQPSSCCLLRFSCLPWCSKYLRHKLQNKWSISLLIHRKTFIDSINEAVFYHQTGVLEWQLVVQHVNCLFVLMGKRLKVSLAQLCLWIIMFASQLNLNCIILTAM